MCSSLNYFRKKVVNLLSTISPRNISINGSGISIQQFQLAPPSALPRATIKQYFRTIENYFYVIRDSSQQVAPGQLPLIKAGY